MSSATTAVALVTNTADRMGQETARRLAAKGQTVILGVRDIQSGQPILDELLQQEQSAELLVLDATQQTSVDAAADNLRSRFGRLDILINNHSLALDKGPLNQAPVEDLIATYEANLFGTFRCIQAFVPLLKLSSNPRVVNISSSLGSVMNMTDKRSPYYEAAQPLYARSTPGSMIVMSAPLKNISSAMPWIS